MEDRFGRPTRSIRISITQRCNQNCHYCHGEGQLGDVSEMTPQEIEKIISVAARLGMKSVKYTGGEPLVRDDLVDIIRMSRDHMSDISLTTNGTLLCGVVGELCSAGLDRVNISLDTIQRARYRDITGRDQLSMALSGIRSAVEVGLSPVKVNVVVLEDSSVDDVMNTMEQIWGMGAKPQLIEPIFSADTTSGKISWIEKVLARKSVGETERKMHKRKIYTLFVQGEEKEVEVVRPMHNSRFCANCTRIRVTSNGFIKPCLMHNDGLVDILGPIRQGASLGALENIFTKAVMNRAPYWK